MGVSEVLALVALVVSLATLYVTTFRRGRLHIMDAPTYAMAVTADRAILYLPLIFANTGSRDWPIRNLRVVADSISGRPLSFVATHRALPGSKLPGDRSFAHGFVVPARSTVSGIYEFQSGDPVPSWPGADFEVTLLIQPGRSGRRYVFAGRYTIKVDTSADHHLLLTHENADEPDDAALTRQMPRSVRERLPRLPKPT